MFSVVIHLGRKKTIVEVEGIVIDIVALHLQVKEPSRG